MDDPTTQEALSDALAEIYEASLDPGRWQRVVLMLSDLLGGPAVLFSQDTASPAATVFESVGFDPAFVRSYLEHYSAVNVWTPGISAQPVGAVYANDEVVARERFESSEWYNDWLRPQGLYHGTGTILARTGSLITQFSVIRPLSKGEMPPEKLGLVRLLGPHLQRSIRVHHELSMARAGLTTALECFERLTAAAFITDATGRVLYANGGAERLEAAKAGLHRDRDGRLATEVRSATERLRSIIADAAASSQATLSAPGGTMAIPRRKGRPLVGMVAPFRGRLMSADERRPAALLLVRDPDRVTTPEPGVLRTLYGLTAAEATVTSAIAAGLTVAEIASRNGIGTETVRTHLKRAMAKTGVRRQAELVALALSS